MELEEKYLECLENSGCFVRRMVLNLGEIYSMQRQFEALVEKRIGLMGGMHTNLVDQVGRGEKSVVERMNLKGDMRTNLVGQAEQLAGGSVRKMKMGEEKTSSVHYIRTVG